MIGWSHLLQPAEAESIRAYVGAQALALKRAQEDPDADAK
jgi:hypothetical protein